MKPHNHWPNIKFARTAVAKNRLSEGITNWFFVTRKGHIKVLRRIAKYTTGFKIVTVQFRVK